MDPVSLAAVSLVANPFSSLRSVQTGIRASFEQSPEGVHARKNRLIWWASAGLIFAAGSMATLLGSLVFRWSLAPILASIGATLILTIVVAVLGNLIYRSALRAFTPQAALDAEKQREEEQDRLMRDTTLPALLKANRDQMGAYHQIATAQARLAGRSSQTAMAIGFAALVAGSVVAILSPSITTKLITGGLAALGGIFSGYIARTFLAAQDKAISQLYKYWEQPLTTSYILAVERVANEFADSKLREKELGKLIDQLLMIAIQREVPSVESRDGSSMTRPRSRRAKSDQRISEDGSSQHSEQ